MPAVRFSASPPPPPPPPPPPCRSSPEATLVQPVRSALSKTGPSLEVTLGLILRAHERRYPGQDALPPRSASKASPHQSSAEIAALKRRSHPPRPPRPSSAVLQETQAYLESTLRPSVMRRQDVEAWVEDSLHAQTLDDGATENGHRRSAPLGAGAWPTFEQCTSTPGAKTKAGDESQPRMKSASFSSSLGKRLARSQSDLRNWLRSPSVQGSATRSRSISLATEANDDEQAPAAGSDGRWSSSSRRRRLRLSDGSQRPLLVASHSPPRYRSVLTGLHRRFYSNDADSDSDSSWSSFGCVDGMRRPSTEAAAQRAKSGSGEVADGAKHGGAVEEERLKKKTLTRMASRLRLPVP